MNHPTKEDLMSLLYNEATDGQRAELNAHLRNCGECREQFAHWQKVKGELRLWQLSPLPKRKSLSVARVLPWAAAALFMFFVGLGLGRWATPSVDAEKLRASIKAEVRQEFVTELKAARETDRKQVIAMLKDIEERRLSDYTQLRKDLETVAVVADEKLTKTERVLRQANLFAQKQ